MKRGLQIKLIAAWQPEVSFRVRILRRIPTARSMPDGVEAFMFAFARELWRETATRAE